MRGMAIGELMSALKILSFIYCTYLRVKYVLKVFSSTVSRPIKTAALQLLIIPHEAIHLFLAIYRYTYSFIPSRS